MEANIENYSFKLDSDNKQIIVYERSNVEEPYSYIHLTQNLSEKDFHYEISDWYMQYVNS